jgi:hypothetical protein
MRFTGWSGLRGEQAPDCSQLSRTSAVLPAQDGPEQGRRTACAALAVSVRWRKRKRTSAARFAGQLVLLVLEKAERSVKFLDDCWAHDAKPIHAHHPALSKVILTPKIIPRAIHRRDIEAVARAVAGQGWLSRSQSNSDYAARGERGDPRGRKSGAGLSLRNPSFPARAEGEKRLRSATRNP